MVKNKTILIFFSEDSEWRALWTNTHLRDLFSCGPNQCYNAGEDFDVLEHFTETPDQFDALEESSETQDQVMDKSG